MKYLLLTAVLLLTGWRYHDKVYINTGFYEGCYGTIVDKYEAPWINNLYLVNLNCNGTKLYKKLIEHSEMELSGRGG